MEPLIFIVEDSLTYGELLERNIVHRLGYATEWRRSYAEAEEYLGVNPQITLALLDFRLPDAYNGEIIDLLAKHQIPSVVITADFNNDLQEFIWSKRVIDYVVKEGPHSIYYLLDLIERFTQNHLVEILIVDDSEVARLHIRDILSLQRYTLLEASNGTEALRILEDNPNIKLVLVDYTMPEMDGFELTRRIRQKYPMDKLAIIGLSASANHQLTVKFIKYGANDFLSKPFLSEMLYTRINLNLKIVEHFEALRKVSLIDHLTNINNRRYLFEAGDLIFEDALRTDNFPVVAMIDLDHFKKINDVYGHDQGDEVIRRTAETLQMNIRKSDILSRYGGEEFCIVCRNLKPERISAFFNEMREKVADLVYEKGDSKFHVSISIGVCAEKKDSFLEMLKAADEKLYEAKAAGRNTVCISPERVYTKKRERYSWNRSVIRTVTIRSSTSRYTRQRGKSR